MRQVSLRFCHIGGAWGWQTLKSSLLQVWFWVLMKKLVTWSISYSLWGLGMWPFCVAALRSLGFLHGTWHLPERASQPETHRSCRLYLILPQELPGASKIFCSSKSQTHQIQWEMAQILPLIGLWIWRPLSNTTPCSLEILFWRSRIEYIPLHSHYRCSDGHAADIHKL